MLRQTTPQQPAHGNKRHRATCIGNTGGLGVRDLGGHKPGSNSGYRPGSNSGYRPGSNSGASRPTSRNSKAKVATSQGKHWKLQCTEFEKDLTDGFRRRLRRLGTQRVMELKDGIDNPNARSSPRNSAIGGDGDTNGALVILSSATFQPSASQLGVRACSLPRLGSRGSALKGLAPGGQRSSLSRSNTAPIKAPLPGRLASLITGSCSTSATRSLDCQPCTTRTDQLPLVDSLTLENRLKWGVEAADRHRLLVQARVIADEDNLGHNCHGRGLMDNFSYKCSCCERTHELHPQVEA